MLLEINPSNIDQRLIQQIVVALKQGGLIIIPTDTVYGIACDLYNKKALQSLAQFKNIKLNKARFSMICHSMSDLSQYVKPIDRPTFKLLKHHLPGPFTFILQASSEIPKLFDSNRKEIGIRIPNNEIVLQLVEALGNPLASTSLHDEEDEIMDYFTDPYEMYQRYDDQVAIIIDGGMGRLDASTIVDCTTGAAVIVRQGIAHLEI